MKEVALTVAVAPVHMLVMAVLIWEQQGGWAAVVAAVVVATVVVATVVVAAVVVVAAPHPEAQLGAAGQRVEAPVNHVRVGPVPPRAWQTVVKVVVSKVDAW